MSVIFPRLHPVTVACWAVLYLICVLYDDPNSGQDVVHAIAPLVALGGAALIGGAMVGSKVIGGIQKARENKAAIRRFLASPEYKALNSAQKKAALRQKLNQYGLSEAAKRRMTEEAGMQYTAMVGKTEADLQAGKADPTQMAQKRELVDRIRGGAEDVATKTRAAAETQSNVVASKQQAADLNLMKSAAALRQGVETGKAAAANQMTDAVVGGIQDVGTLGMNVLTAGAGAAGDPRTTASGVYQNMGQTGTATKPAAGMGGQ